MRSAHFAKAPRQALFIALVFVTGCQTVGRSVPGVPNFAKVDDGLYRGGQPSEAGVGTLQAKGVRTVIDLRDDANPAERWWVELHGMTYVRIPQNAARVEPDKLAAFLAQVEAAPKPIFVHCRRGRDRTGLGVAMYRIVTQGWTRQEALRELYAHGHQWPFFPGIARYVRTFERTAFHPPDLNVSAETGVEAGAGAEAGGG